MKNLMKIPLIAIGVPLGLVCLIAAMITAIPICAYFFQDMNISKNEIERIKTSIAANNRIQRIQVYQSGKIVYLSSLIQTSRDAEEMTSAIYYWYDENRYDMATQQFKNVDNKTTRYTTYTSYTKVDNFFQPGIKIQTEEETIDETRKEFTDRFTINNSFVNEIVKRINKGRYSKRESLFFGRNKTGDLFDACNLTLKESCSPYISLYERQFQIESVKSIFASSENAKVMNFSGMINGEQAKLDITFRT